MNTQLVWLTAVCARAQHPDLRASSAAEAAVFADRIVDEFLERYGCAQQRAERSKLSKKSAVPEMPPLPAIPTPAADFAATEVAGLTVGDPQLDAYLEGIGRTR